MRMLAAKSRRRLCALAASGIPPLAAAGRSCLQWRPTRAAQRSELEKSPGGPFQDGTIALPSRPDGRVPPAATRMTGYGAARGGVLSDEDALRELGRALDAATGAALATVGSR